LQSLAYFEFCPTRDSEAHKLPPGGARLKRQRALIF